MALTKHFRETIRERAQREPRFRKALLREAIELMFRGREDGPRDPAELYQRHGWLSATRKGDIHPRQQPNANVRPKWQPFGKKPVWHPRSSSGTGRREL